jgi:hypothetical protein
MLITFTSVAAADLLVKRPTCVGLTRHGADQAVILRDAASKPAYVDAEGPPVGGRVRPKPFR